MSEQINYQPDFNYSLDDVPANDYIAETFEMEGHISVKDTKKKVENTLTNADFLIKKSEEELTGQTYNQVSFSDYKDLAVKKYYCQTGLCRSEANKLKDFEDGVKAIDGDLAGSIYPRLLQHKSDLESNLGHVNELEGLETKKLDQILTRTSRFTTDGSPTSTDVVSQTQPSESKQVTNISNLDQEEQQEVVQQAVSGGMVFGEFVGKYRIDDISTLEYLSKQWDEYKDRTEDYASDYLQNMKNILLTNDMETDGYNEEISEYASQKLFGEDVQMNYKQKIAAVNSKIDMMETRKEELKSEYKKAVSNGNDKRADNLKNKIENLNSKISEVINQDVGYTAKESYILHTKAEEADNFLKKAGYLLMSTPFDSFGRNPCCFIKIILKSIEIGDKNALEHLRTAENELDEFQDEAVSVNGKRYSIEEIKHIVDCMRSLLAVAYGKNQKKAQQLINQLENLILSPIESALVQALHILADLHNAVIGEVSDWFRFTTELDPENPSNLLDCFTFEAIADAIYDIIEDIFDDIEESILDLYKTVYSYADFLDKDILILGQKKWIMDAYKLLTELSKTLETIDNFSVVDNVEQLIESLLYESGFGATYNQKTGKVEPVVLTNCIDPTPYDGNSKSVMPEKPKDLDDLILVNNDDYQDFVNNDESINYTCNYNAEEEQKVAEASGLTKEDINEIIEDNLET